MGGPGGWKWREAMQNNKAHLKERLEEIVLIHFISCSRNVLSFGLISYLVNKYTIKSRNEHSEDLRAVLKD